MMEIRFSQSTLTDKAIMKHYKIREYKHKPKKKVLCILHTLHLEYSL